ncbi:phosphoenolpyruvate-protein phosphotransferase [Thiohalobacter thiocyanaticus]|uniref:Phosphoenolpyruvate-protein phosphotransferase n=1 Tax=Thiohalobacter thiocyanaticus TaxID=585455 RepID=A0A1Z4VN70_9GAMM|nr:putative PEP-binding protein [Thiohalobacter thiocyanaticus]BAZ93061.1 phosphoenolpyruvate-protein phosphotransferase [Thiohalobacter thiocyanaticus]
MPSEPIIHGMPYFPGRAAGRLHTRPDSLTGQHIALITPGDIRHITGLPAGFLIVEPTPFSHAMITLLGLGIPTVLIEAGQAQALQTGMPVGIDGMTGEIGINAGIPARHAPSPRQRRPGARLNTVDGTRVRLLASVRSAAAARQAAAAGASGIGLVRSEFLSPQDGTIPDADFYRRSFRDLLDAAAPLPVTVRLLDLAADKLPAWLPPTPRLGEPLGLQGVRLYHTRPIQQVIRDQLTALAELADTHSIRLLLPFIVRLEELQCWQTMARRRLPDSVRIGAMAETLAAVLDIPHLLDSADFVAIGCNDLMQAVFSADRDEPVLRHYLDPYAPVLFRLFRQIAASAGERLERIQLCGVLAQIQGVLPVLLGLGYRNFSVDAPFIPHLADTIAGISLSDCEALAADICTARTTQQSLEILQLDSQRHPPYLA